MKKLKKEIKQLKRELERLDNNLAYLKGKLDNQDKPLGFR